jgi:antirestriction protein ArdC
LLTFNAEQANGIAIPVRRPVEGLEAAVQRAEAVCAKMPKKPKIEHNPFHRPTYSPLEDLVRMPPKGTFLGTGYHQTLFHELVHATGHGSRLGRLSPLSKDRHERLKEYSLEELVAELGSAYLSAHCGLDAAHEQSAAYIDGWSKALSKKDNVAWVVRAAGQAQKAADYILDEKDEEN